MLSRVKNGVITPIEKRNGVRNRLLVFTHDNPDLPIIVHMPMVVSITSVYILDVFSGHSVIFPRQSLIVVA